MSSPIVIDRESAFTPLNKVLWMKAFRHRAKRVELRDGREFKLRYGNRRFGNRSEATDYVWFEPASEEFAPCGYLRMEIVTAKSWLTESDRPDMPDGKYVLMLDKFIDSDIQGTEVRDLWPDLKGRLKATLQRGFSQAKIHRGKAADHVKVVTDGDAVFLLKDKNGE
jgi:hypothetical protein